MAWRIDESVVRGEIDNRVRGCVMGLIWFAGRLEPVRLELAGNCWRDLAGRRLTFTNPQPRPDDLGKLAGLQRGVVGDITASRKVKVPDFPLKELDQYYKTGREWTWHWGNSLYLEWFGERNGRVVIETTSFDLKIAGESAWEMTEGEEAIQQGVNGLAMAGFMDRVAQAMSGETAERAGENEEEETERDES